MICLCRLPLLMAAACQLPQSCGLPFVLTLSSAAPSQGGLRRGHARMQLSDALVDQVQPSDLRDTELPSHDCRPLLVERLRTAPATLFR